MLNEPRHTALEPAEIADRAVEALSEKQATDIVLIDLGKAANFTDFFVIASATSERHMNALVEAVDQALSAVDEEPLHVEGTAASGWVLMDYGPVIVHVFSPEYRAYYNLEGLWAKAAPVVHFQ